MLTENQFHNRYIDQSYLEEKSKFGYNPWSVLVQESLLVEAAKDVSSDDENPEATPDQEQEAQPQNVDAESQGEGENPEAAGEDEMSPEEGEPEAGLLSDEELMQLIQGFQSGEVTEETLKELLDSGKINQTDIQKIQENMPTPEEEQSQQITQVQEMVIRFNVYDKIMNLDSKLELFMENFNEVGSGFYKDVQQVHEFIKVLNTLIFNLEINLVYQMYASLEMQLIQLFEDYKENTATTEGKNNV